MGLNGARTYSFGAPDRSRTCDLRYRKPALYPLSYGGVRRCVHGLTRIPAARAVIGDWLRCSVSDMRRILATVAVALVLAGCGGADKEEPAAEGTVSMVQDAGDPFVFVLSTEPQSSLNNAIITVDARNIEGAEPSEIERGDEVKVWAQVCTQSIPAQCQATSVEVVGK